MDLDRLLAWWKWLLEFNLLKFTGMAIMIAGPLSLVYFYLFDGLRMWMLFLGSFISFSAGFIVWLNGWDPYETIIKEKSANDILKSLKDIFGFVEWYKWLLEFNIKKYIALFLMTCCPLFFIYMAVFRGFDTLYTIIYSAAFFVVGTIIWIITWDPYS